MPEKPYMNGARDRLAKWHAALRRISGKLDEIQRSIKALDASLQDSRTLADNYSFIMQVDIPFAGRFLREVPAEILIEALRDKSLLNKLETVIEAAKK